MSGGDIYIPEKNITFNYPLLQNRIEILEFDKTKVGEADSDIYNIIYEGRPKGIVVVNWFSINPLHVKTVVVENKFWK